MGLFSGIKKFFKKVWSGIKKVFKAIMKPIGKLLNSKLGKAIMLGVTIFTLGSALLAGGKAFLGAEGFINKFVEGGKAFMNSLLGKGEISENAAQAGADPGVTSLTDEAVKQGTEATANVLTEGVDNAVKGVADATEIIPSAMEQGGNLAASGTPGMPDMANQMLGQGGALSTPQVQSPGAWAGSAAGRESAKQIAAETVGQIGTGAQKSGGWLANAAKAAGDFIKTPGGGTFAGSVVKGVGDYYTVKDQQEFDDRIRRQFMDPNDPSRQRYLNFDFNLDVPHNLAGGVSRAGPRELNRTRQLPTVPFRRTPYQGSGG